METTRCSGSDVQADSPVCPGCGNEHDRYRDNVAGRIVFRFVEHGRQAEVPDALVRSILEPSLFDDLERSLIDAALAVQQVAARAGELTDESELHALQIRAAVVASYADALDSELARLRRSAA